MLYEVITLDDAGFILETNKAWRLFAHQNDLHVLPEKLEVNYLEICDNASDETDGESSEVAQGIRDVIAGKIEEFILDYPCHSPEERRWFSMKVTRAVDSDPVRVRITSYNVCYTKLLRRAIDADEVRIAGINRQPTHQTNKPQRTSPHGQHRQ